MPSKTKKLFSNLKKSVTLVLNPAKPNLWFGAVLIFIVLGLVLPICPAHAFSIMGWGKGVLETGINLYFGFLFQILVVAGSVLLGIAAGILGWITNLDLPYTSLTYKGAQTIVGIGWPLVRDLANIGIILALVYIGLATALRIASFQTKKTLITLIGIALLINFTPVICGVIVDASNIVMNFFLEDLTGWDTFLVPYRGLAISWQEFFKDSTNFNFLGQSIAMAAFCWIGALVLFLYTLLFLLRYVAIWILVILSPLAFMCYILPSTRKIFSQWWNQFIQWSFIGAIAAFFLYLSRHLLFFASEGKLLDTAGLPESAEVAGGVLPYFVVIVFLYIGFFAGFSIAGMGSKGVIQGFQQGAKKGGKWAKEKGWAGLKSSAAKTLTRERQPKIPKEERKKMTGGQRMGYWAKRGLAGVMFPATKLAAPFAPYALQARKTAIEAGEKEAEAIKEETLLMRKIKTPGISADRKIGLVAGGIKKGKGFKKLIEQELSPEKATKLALEANNIGAGAQAEVIARTFIKDADKMGFKPLSTEDEAKDYNTIQEKLIGDAKGDDIKHFAKNFWTSPDVMKAVQKFWGGPQLGKAADEFGRDFVDDYMKGIEVIPHNVDVMLQTNPKSLLYLSGNAAQDLGYRSPGGLDRKEVREKLEAYKKGKYTPEVIIAPPGPSVEKEKKEKEKPLKDTGVFGAKKRKIKDTGK